ncbi:MAG: allantoicase [Acidimicrobiia bacterium]
MIDLLSNAVGGHVVACNDQFFAEAANLLKVSEPEWKEGVYTDHGKWMDGWETRRRREPGHDWVVLALGIPGRVRRVVVDTSYFTGNYPEAFSLEACGVGSDERVDSAGWAELIPRTPLEGDAVATFDVTEPHRVTHVRVNIYPDGGVARLRVHGHPLPSIGLVCPEEPTDLAGAAVGGQALDASDSHYSDPSNLLLPTKPAGMWDGWETRRRRQSGHDWATFRLGLPGTVERLVVDTTHFKGNAPGWVSFEVSEEGTAWETVIERAPVQPDAVNVVPMEPPAPAAFVRLSLHPDGGVARLRVMGRPAARVAVTRRLEYLNALFDPEAQRFFNAVCASSRWVETMVSARPFESPKSAFISAEEAFGLLEPGDWLEAFAGHPRIGESGDAVSAREQAGTARAPRRLLEELAAVNAEYERRFGFTYIVYATGKTAEEMLEIARGRLNNAKEEELSNAAAEQKKITWTRLRRMLCVSEEQ